MYFQSISARVQFLISKVVWFICVTFVEVVELSSEGLFAMKGVKKNWHIEAINGVKVKESRRDHAIEIFNRGHACTITFNLSVTRK